MKNIFKKSLGSNNYQKLIIIERFIKFEEIEVVYCVIYL